MNNELLIGINLPTMANPDAHFDVEHVGAAAEWAEAVGFDIVWVPDHLFHAQQLLESLTTLAYVAGRTKTIKLGTAVYLLTLRPTALAARQIATLASLSGGRLVLALGVGGEWPKEWAAVGVPTNERGARLDEALPLLRSLLLGEEVDFSGRFNTLPGVRIAPPPPPVPLYVAGRAPAAMKRAALLGDGWHGLFLTVNGFKRDTAQLLALREEAGIADRPYKLGMQICYRIDQNNDGAQLRAAECMNANFPPGTALTPADKLQHLMVAGTAERVAEHLLEFRDAGCSMFSLTPMNNGPDVQDQLDMFAADVIPHLRKA